MDDDTNKTTQMKNKKFRLPRKEKKRLKGHIWLYPPYKDGSRLMAWPTKSQEDYDAMKTGEVRDIMDKTNTLKYERKEKLKKIKNGDIRDTEEKSTD